MSIKTKCVCGRTYINYNDLCTVCRKVEQKPFDMLSYIGDGIDIDKEQEIIYTEISEQDQQDFPRDNRVRSEMKKTHLSSSQFRRLLRDQDRETINRFRKNQKGSAIDVTKLG